MLRLLTSDEVGKRIKSVRTASGLNQEELARKLGAKSANMISRLEQGAAKTIDLERLVQISNATSGRWMLSGVSAEDVLDYLVGRIDSIEASIAGSSE